MLKDDSVIIDLNILKPGFKRYIDDKSLSFLRK